MAAQANPRAGGSDAAAMTLLRRAVDAKGGLAALQAVTTVVAEAETALQMPQGTLTSTTKTYVAYPDRFRVDATVPVPPTAVPPGQPTPPPVEVVQIYNAGTAWVRDPSGVHDAPAAMRDDFAASVRRDTIPILVGAMTGQYSVRQLADETSADGAPLKVLEFSGRGVDPIRFYISGDGLIAKQSFSTPGPDGKPLQVEELFSDYRVVNGVRVPFVAQLRRGGQSVMKRTLKNVTINASLAPSLFTRPE
jgi:hypothetical protein